jgi:hypothetical protein
MLALTASQIAAQLRAAAPKIFASHPLRGAFERVLTYAVLLRLLVPTEGPVESTPTSAEQQVAPQQQADEEGAESPYPLDEPNGSTHEI